MKKLAFLIIFLCTLTLNARAAETKVITLQDGSTIKGDVIGMDQGVYTIHNPAMGDMRVPDQNVVSITAASAAVPAAQPQAAAGAAEASAITATPEFQSMQSKMMADPQVMGDIQQMAQDPEIMALLSDPSFISALRSGSAANLQSDPRVKKLSENPRVQALIEKLQANH